jgi:hypothetical protein
MRTIDEIKKTITTAYMNDDTVVKRYGFTFEKGANFDTTFAKTSIESSIFYQLIIMKIIDIFKLNKTTLECVSRHGIPACYVKYINFYDQYSKCIEKGQKRYNIVLSLSEQYGISENTAHKIINLFETSIEC